MGVSIPTKRSRTVRIAALAATAGAVVCGVVAGGSAANAGTSTLVTITAVSPGKIAADTAKRTITVTGTGFDEDVITNVTISGCQTDPTYVVVTATSLVLKTAADCDPSTNNVITVTDTSSNTAVSDPTNAKMKLDFVAPPKLLDPDGSSARPVVTENTHSVAYANQGVTASTSGGTVIRVYADSQVPFATSTACPLAASIDGVALTKVTLGTAGAYFTGVVGAHAADAAPTLKITNNCVSKSFSYDAAFGTQTHDFQLDGTTISVAPSSGAINGGTTLVVTGTGFTSSTTVDVGGNSCVKVSQTATKFTCTTPAATAAGPVTVTATTGSLSSVISSGSTFTYLDQ